MNLIKLFSDFPLQFDAERMGSSDITGSFSKELQQNLNGFQATVEAMLKSYKNALNIYSELMMQNESEKIELYVSEDDLMKMHQSAREEAIAQVRNN